MSLHQLLMMAPSPERDKLAQQLGYTIGTPKYKNTVPKKFKDEANNSVRIKGDPLSKGKSELQIEHELLKYLSLKGIKWWPMKVKGELHISKGRGFIKPSKNPGFPDILCSINGRFVGIEVKKCGGVQSSDQVLMQKEIEKSGAVYFICTSVRELEAALIKYNLI